MIFNSLTFLLFLLVVVSLSWILPRTPRLWMLFFASITFYGFWRLEFVLLLLTSVIIDYYLALAIYKTNSKKTKKLLLIASLCVNLGLLVLFKYSAFISYNLADLFSFFGAELVISSFFLNIILPLGISFYTFQTISYVVDVYRGFIKPERNFALFGTYVTFFPQLVAGPILRAREVIPQLANKPGFDLADIRVGARRIIIGLFMKVVLADNIAPLVDAGFSSELSTLSAIDVWTLAFLFGFQIYFDFSAYSHIAIGSARLMGIRFPENFKFPYISSSPKEFWSRWHISLSSWIRDYLYLPLTKQKVHDRSTGGFEKALTAPPTNTNLTYALFGSWAIMGLWHGANWTFVMWGLYHALLVFMYRKISPFFQDYSNSWRTIIGALVTLPIIMLGWIPFRADSVGVALALYGKLFDYASYSWLGLRENTYIIAAILVLGTTIAFYVSNYFKEIDTRKSGLALFLEACLLIILLPLVYIFLRPISQFIYFQF